MACDEIRIKKVERDDVPLLLNLIKELAEFEKLLDQVAATEEILAESLFGRWGSTEAVLVFRGETPAGYCIFFHNFSTFLGRPGIYVEDIYIRPEFRRSRLGSVVFRHLGGLCRERGCGRLEFSVLDWNESAIRFYRYTGRGKTRRLGHVQDHRRGIGKARLKPGWAVWL